MPFLMLVPDVNVSGTWVSIAPVARACEPAKMSPVTTLAGVFARPLTTLNLLRYGSSGFRIGVTA
jgi:hypothetical protein